MKGYFMTTVILHLYHGRNTPDEEMNDWGFDGPRIECDCVGFTYGTIWIVRNGEREDLTPKGEDLIPWEGKYYGDFEVIAKAEDRGG
jgi:hypothetical protein